MEATQGLRLDATTHCVEVDGRSVRLTESEFCLLSALVAADGATVTREALLQAMWRSTWCGPSRTVDVHVAGLRRKLGDSARAPRWVETVRGEGFRLLAPP
jgi:DNA-binding response OmpR family regulator